jgi:hypothetical protein
LSVRGREKAGLQRSFAQPACHTGTRVLPSRPQSGPEPGHGSRPMAQIGLVRLTPSAGVVRGRPWPESTAAGSQTWFNTPLRSRRARRRRDRPKSGNGGFERPNQVGMRGVQRPIARPIEPPGRGPRSEGGVRCVRLVVTMGSLPQTSEGEATIERPKLAFLRHMSTRNPCTRSARSPLTQPAQAGAFRK